MIDKDLLAILACPETHQGLAEAPAELLARINAAIAAGRLESRGKTKLEGALAGALVREDGQIAYPIRDGIPVLLIDESFAVPSR